MAKRKPTRVSTRPKAKPQLRRGVKTGLSALIVDFERLKENTEKWMTQTHRKETIGQITTLLDVVKQMAVSAQLFEEARRIRELQDRIKAL